MHQYINDYYAELVQCESVGTSLTDCNSQKATNTTTWLLHCNYTNKYLTLSRRLRFFFHKFNVFLHFIWNGPCHFSSRYLFFFVILSLMKFSFVVDIVKLKSSVFIFVECYCFINWVLDFELRDIYLLQIIFIYSLTMRK